MSHPYKSHAQNAASKRRATQFVGTVKRAEGGRTREPMGVDLPEIRSTPPARGGSGSDFPNKFYGTSPEPSIGKQIWGPDRKGGNSHTRTSPTIYPNTPEGRSRMNRQIDKYDNEYGAYRYKGKDVVDE